MRRPTFDLDVLRSFVLGVELGSFAKAADRLGRSPPAISAQLKKLEETVGQPVLQKSGRGMALTPTGELLFGYAKRLLALNDEAALAVRGAGLEGCVRLGLQEDFGENLLTETLGRFARAHPRLRIEARVARNAELIERVGKGEIDLALAWDGGPPLPHRHWIADIPLCWIGSDARLDYGGDPLPMVAFEAPCLMRVAATGVLDRAGIAWRLAFTSASLSGIWAAVAAGLGITVRTRVGLPAHLRVLSDLPALPSIGLALYRAESDPAEPVRRLEEILLTALDEVLRIPAPGE